MQECVCVRESVGVCVCVCVSERLCACESACVCVCVYNKLVRYNNQHDTLILPQSATLNRNFTAE